MFPNKEEKFFDEKKKKKKMISAFGLPLNSDREKELILKSKNDILPVL